ncbi:MAG TPA: YpdA family putative bacillithiol disulfide reductase [Gemmatimonadaceae bacterium]|nr:YpdA family putative bacillithiol disulfide reductase [Gemmatimonadaceae bacterium]
MIVDAAERLDAVIIGAGPCGLAAGIAFKRAGLRAVIIDRSCVVSGIAGYPTYITFFSTPERLSIGGVPFIVATEKPTRRDALAYYRAVTTMFDLDVRQYENVERIRRCDDAFAVDSRTRHGELRETRGRAVVIATGYFGHPNRLDVPGEDLPHVTHLFTEGHWAFRQDAVVVGGGNSAVEVALDLYRSGARTTVVHFLPQLDHNIKPWVLPDITNRIKEGSIGARFSSRVREITPEHVVLDTPNGIDRVRADHVYLMVGYQPNAQLLVQLEVPIDPATGIPAHDPATMETRVPGVFIAGVIASGNDANKTFIENGRFHGDLIARRLVAAP